MPTLAMWGWARRWGMEAVLAVLAGLVFLGFLGSVDLWGKREQRASAEAIDTVDHDHWLVAQIQGRPRLEKPPLPRWTIATLMHPDRPARRDGSSGSRGLGGDRDGGAGLRPWVPAGRPRGRPRVGPGPDLDGFFDQRAPAGGQRRPARLLHHPGPLRRLATAARRPRRESGRDRAEHARDGAGVGAGTWCSTGRWGSGS